MQFLYKAINTAGDTVEAEAEAADRFSLARTLRAQELTVISISPAVLGQNKYVPQFIQGLFTHISLRDKILFATNISAMIKAGLPLTRALGVVERQTTNKNFAEVLKGLITRVEGGKSFSQAIRDYPNVFPPIFGAMTAAGEESGNLAEALSIIGNQLNKTYELRRKIRGAMLYPAIVLGAIVAVGVLMMIYLVPILSATFKELEVPLPLSTRLVVAASDFMANSTILFVAILCVIVLAVWRSAKTSRGREFLQKFYLKLPVIGELVKKANAAVTMRTLSSLISAGVGVVDALIITEGVLQNIFYKRILIDAAKQVGSGGALSKTLSGSAGLYPVLVGEMVAVGEETGALSEMLLKGAVFYEDEVDQSTKNLSTIVEPLLMIFVGVAVGFFAISMISPIYSLVNFI